jgi:UDPglucose 6-dehydrogenase
LNFTTEIESTIKKSSIIFICVNTPTKLEGEGAGRACNLKYVESAARMIGRALNETELQYDVVLVEKSTVPVGTNDVIRKILMETLTDYPQNLTKISILSNPEFLSEGVAVQNLLKPDRVLIGGGQDGNSRRAIDQLKEIYLKWVEPSRIITTNIYSSELAKLAANCMLAQRVSSINSFSAICEKVGADIDESKTPLYCLLITVLLL